MTATGGTAAGGAPTGGKASGGSATGGKATGGSATGGTATGGTPTGGSAGTTFVEDDGVNCTIGTLPSGTLPTIAKLPDPFTKLDGTRMTTKAEWRCRREEIRKLAEKFAYGTKPPPAPTVTGTVSRTICRSSRRRRRGRRAVPRAALPAQYRSAAGCARGDPVGRGTPRPPAPPRRSSRPRPVAVPGQELGDLGRMAGRAPDVRRPDPGDDEHLHGATASPGACAEPAGRERLSRPPRRRSWRSARRRRRRSHPTSTRARA